MREGEAPAREGRRGEARAEGLVSSSASMAPAVTKRPHASEELGLVRVKG